MPEDSPAIPGFEDFVPRLRQPTLNNYPGELIQLSTGRDIFIGVISLQGTDTSLSRAETLSLLTPEQQVWEEAQGWMTAQARMSKFEAVFWGCPQGDFSLLVSDERHPDLDTYPRKFSARLNSTGRTCLTSSGNLAYALSSPGIPPHSVKDSPVQNCYDGSLFDLPEGSYVITVTQMFPWRNSQFARTNREHIHYHIHYCPLSEHTGSLVTEIPWVTIPRPN